MTRPLSNDLRERVVRAMGFGESCRSVAAHCGVVGCEAVAGSVAPGKMG